MVRLGEQSKSLTVPSKHSKQTFQATSKMATAAEIKAELEAGFTEAFHRGLNIKTCEHCGMEGAGGEVHCDCEELIERYGSIGCSCCGIEYGIPYLHILQYIDNWGGDDEAEDMAKSCYASDMLFKMPKPCEKCSDIYIQEHTYLWTEYETWLTSYNRRHWKEIQSEYSDWDDDHCTSGICRCCGSTPSGYW